MEKIYYDATLVKVTKKQAIYSWQGEKLCRPLPGRYQEVPLGIGEIGLLIVDDNASHIEIFVPYAEQRLRRVMEYDVGNQWGWQLDGEDTPIRVLAGIIPGVEGAVIKEDTRPLMLPIPAEFFAFCNRYRLNVEEILRTFIADACNLQHTLSLPREDDYHSEYEDLRGMVSAYLESAYGLSTKIVNGHLPG